MDPHEHLAGGRLRLGQLDDAEGIGFDGGGGYEYTGLQGLIIPRGDGVEPKTASETQTATRRIRGMRLGLQFLRFFQKAVISAPT
jgi:hypothetical protein